MRILVDREEEWSVRMEMIEGAQRFLILTTYYFDRGDLSGLMLDALIAAARRGVRVVLVVDKFGQRLGGQMSLPAQPTRLSERLHDLRAAGGAVVHYSPRAFRHRAVGGGLHVKIQVSEAGVAVFGSSNIAHHSFRQWNEVSLAIEGDMVAHLLDEACRFAGLSERESSAFMALLPTPQTDPTSQPLRYLREEPEERSDRFFPWGRVDNRLTAELVNLIDSAQQSLFITTFYYKPPPILRKAILRACARGADVRIFHSHRASLQASALPWMSCTYQYDEIIAAGGQIYENIAGEHSKVVLVDHRKVAVGSYNFEHAAHDRLIEAMLFSDEPAVCEQFGSFFERLRHSADNIALSSTWASELPFVMQVQRWFYRPLQRWI